MVTQRWPQGNNGVLLNHMRALSLALSTLLLCACTPQATQIQPRTLNPWTWTVLDRTTAHYVHWRSNPLPADSSAHLKTAWDDSNLYFAAYIYDDLQVADSTDVWRDDSLEIGIDGLNDSIGWHADDHQFTFTIDDRVTDYGIPAPQVIAATGTFTNGWTLELAIPVHVLAAGPLVEGKRMGFTFGLHDDDDGGDWDSYMIWQGDSTNNSANYGVIVLAKPDVTPTATPTAIPATLTPTPTVTSTPTATATATPTATLASTPTPTHTLTPTPTATPPPAPTATPPPSLIWICECHQVTVTPTPNSAATGRGEGWH